ncbi:nuclease-related domain-containing protein [Psychrobacter sp. SZ93C1]|uniref:nuclease-related domain-containing protein n=1 Tax=Psychrobacter sp. SZ93C1 TaxID=2792058 RepID=UPI0018CFB5B5|nr:nuclease-related domain-containing protein [Psychrobacter sp. SZ93C1]MBH0064333.1 NERD domain-containing protein [Psychrobacter sp. SZ93C1]
MYFDKQFSTFFLGSNNDEALLKTLEVLLFKSSTSGKFNSVSDKLNDFWTSNFIESVTMEQMNNENFILALSQYIRSKSIDKDIVIKLLELNQPSVIKAIRQSGIIANADHCSWGVLSEINNQIDLLEFKKFLLTVEYIQLQYQERFNAYKEFKDQTQLDQVTAMIFSSLYACEYLILSSKSIDNLYTKIPYQYGVEEYIPVENVWKAFNHIITSANIQKKEFTEKTLALIFKGTMMPFILGQNLNDKLITSYDSFKRMVACQIEINLYRDQVIDSYCFDLETHYYLENNQLRLESSSKEPDLFSDKLSILSSYWLYRAFNSLEKSPYLIRLDKGVNFEANITALAKTQGIILQLEEIYGVKKADFGEVYDLSALIFTMLMIQMHFEYNFVQPFKEMARNAEMYPFIAIGRLVIDGLSKGQDRMPLNHAKMKDRAIKMSDWILEGSGNSKKREMSRILDFWSQDLREGESSSYGEKSFYKLDGYMFSLPWVTFQKNFNTATINTFRKLYKNRANLKSETDLMEQNLAELLAKYKGRVYSQYEPSEPGVGEIDAIVVTDNKVLVIELKSTYVKSSVKEIYEYRNFVLKKAAYQLSRKSGYVRDVFLPSLGLDSSQFSIHSWIVDTTLEFDHEYIDGFLKISFEELVIILNGHGQYFSNMLDNDNTNKNPLSAYEENLEALIKSVEDNAFWNTNLPLMSSIQDLNNASTLKA